MPRHFLNELRDGDTVDDVYLLADKQLRANRNGDTYLLAQLRDKSGQMSALMWNVDPADFADLGAGDYASVRGKVQLYQGGLQMILNGIRKADATHIDPLDYHPSSGQDVQKLTTELKETLLSLENDDLRMLMECYLVDEELVGKLQTAPAGVKLHHAYHGGLIEHIVTLLRVAHAIEPIYPQVDHELLQVGLFLHDLGKLQELAFDVSFSYTDNGQLIGHLVIGVEMLNEKLTAFSEMTGRDFPEDLALHLKHLILSHHGTHQFGSPKLPMTPEAIALHHLDNLDAKINEFTTAIKEDPNAESDWTPYNPRTERKLYKAGVTIERE